jgi:hypothetical protein
MSAPLATITQLHTYRDGDMEHAVLMLANPVTGRALEVFVDKTGNNDAMRAAFPDAERSHAKRANAVENGALLAYLQSAVIIMRSATDASKNTMGGQFTQSPEQEQIGKVFRLIPEADAFRMFSNLAVEGAPATFTGAREGTKIECVVSRVSDPIYTHATAIFVVSRRA